MSHSTLLRLSFRVKRKMEGILTAMVLDAPVTPFQQRQRWIPSN